MKSTDMIAYLSSSSREMITNELTTDAREGTLVICFASGKNDIENIIRPKTFNVFIISRL